MHKVLILGAGMVARPMVRYLLENGIRVTLASRTVSKAEAMIQGHPLGKAISWTVTDEATLDRLVSEHDVVVSLLPYAHHLLVAKHCLQHQRNMVTTSYIKPEMQALDGEAREKYVLILNEIGLDPGIDHMSAMRIIDHVHGKKGKIREFYSLCGALPAPEAADNPFRYKFSWSPRGVIMAGNNTGKYLKNKQVVDVPTEELFRNTFRLHFPQAGEMEVYPNRDSLIYRDSYGISETETLFRGTFRFPGWCETFDALKALHLTSTEKIPLKGKTYAGMLASLMGEEETHPIRPVVAEHLKLTSNAHALDAMEWLGLFSDRPLNRDEDSPFEVLAGLMLEKMMLGKNERDMVVMQHTFLAEYPGGKEEVIRSRMLDYGAPGKDTAVARTVSLPAAIAVRMILEGNIRTKGVRRPVIPEIYEPVLNELEKVNIRLTEEFDLPVSENIQW